MLAFRHTAHSHIETFDSLLREFDDCTSRRHAVHAELLAAARVAGMVTPALRRWLADTIDVLVAQGATVILCPCSTIGAAAEAAPLPSGVLVLRVDHPMAERAVALGSCIAVVAVLASTLAPTRQLLHESAARAGREIEVNDMLGDGAWEHFERGDSGRSLAQVAQTLERAAQRGDVVVMMAQASMACVVELVPNLRVPVLSSPRLGLEAAVRACRS